MLASHKVSVQRGQWPLLIYQPKTNFTSIWRLAGGDLGPHHPPPQKTCLMLYIFDLSLSFSLTLQILCTLQTHNQPSKKSPKKSPIPSWLCCSFSLTLRPVASWASLCASCATWYTAQLTALTAAPVTLLCLSSTHSHSRSLAQSLTHAVVQSNMPAYTDRAWEDGGVLMVQPANVQIMKSSLHMLDFVYMHVSVGGNCTIKAQQPQCKSINLF